MQAFFSRAGLALLCLLLVALLIAALFWALSIGTVNLPPDVIAAAILDQLGSNTPIDTAGKGPVHDIVWLLRLPRLLLAAIIGAGLATCGIIMQAIVKNPLADPYILGISAGASLGATSAVLLGIGAALGENAVGISAFLGAFAVSIGVLFIANLGGRASAMKLLLGGMALSAVCSALVVGFAVFAAGMIGFVGLVVPHVVRMLVGTDHKRLIPVTALTGAIFLVVADGLCRVIIPHTELPIGILIALVGAPAFIYLMVKRTYGFGGQ